MVICETARSAHPKLSQELKEVTCNAEKLGTLGTSLYLCENYTTPLHEDNDCVRGLVAQLELTSNTNLREFAFIYATYGLYVVPLINSLW